MKVKVTSEIHIDIKGKMDKVNGDKLGTFAATEWHRLYTPYVPMDTGALANTVQIRPWEIEHTVPYAHRMYEGHFNFRKDMHPAASRHWDKAAEPTEKPKLVKAIQAFIDKGGLNLGK